ncbi:Nif3-like dinuclear metal center hexameric protein, partial [Litorivivens sp.]|uniref:Nif3-like dinuclear metal center hexameric protein n=1 Tax=Litorivivens sp. TaxID=2020868 RepID=UPI00356271D6
YTGQLLQIERFRDYCPNGLQVAGATEIQTMVSGVTASMALLEAAVEEGAELVMVHHGYFWKNEDACLVGIKRRRLKFLLEHDLNLLAYHLPLDAHPELGNNAQLARKLGFRLESWAGEQSLVACGRLGSPTPLFKLGQQIASVLHREPMIIGNNAAVINRIAWCTGAAQDYLDVAIEQGVDAFLTGEISERTVHLALESGVAFIAAGHHATERYGVQSLGDHLAKRFGIKHCFIDINNPV